MIDGNFLPNIKCPHCGTSLVTSISGFGSELNIREKECYKCHKPYFVHIYVTTSIEKTVEDGIIKSWKTKIKFLIKQRKNNLTEQLLEYKIARKVNKEALKMAVDMEKKRGMN